MKPPAPWSLTLQVAFAVATTIGLSIWQLSRGFDKLELRAGFEAALAAPVVAEDVREELPDYRRVSLTGHFDQEISFLVDNRRHLGRPGYWVITSFDTAYGRFLVNRGWLSAGPNMRELPEIETPDGEQQVEGVVWPNLPVSALAKSEAWSERWPVRVRGLDVPRMADRVRSFGREVRLTRASDGLLQPAPLAVDFATAKHWGYALQWLLIGGLIVAGYWYFGVRQGRSRDERGGDG